MRLFLFALFLGAAMTTFGQWTNLNSGINDRLNDVYFRDANNGVVAGSKGIYYTTSGGSGPSSWNRFAPSNPTDLALYNRCKFLKIAADPASAKTYICGIDTVNAKAVMFYFKSDDQGYLFVYQGAANTAFYDIKFGSGEVFAVGTAGLLVRYNTSSGIVFTFPSITSKTLRCLSFEQFSTSTIYMGGDSVIVRANISGNTANSTVEMVNRVFTSMAADFQTIYAVGPSGYFRAPSSNIGVVSEITSYRFGPLHATSMFKASPSNEIYVTTDHGVFKKLGDPLEQQPTSASYSLNGFNLSYSSTTAYACGENGVVLKSTNSGGVTIPYINAFLSTGCKNDQVTLTREQGGSGNNCQFAGFDASNNQVGFTINTGCSLSFSTNWSSSGPFTFRYIVTNGTYSDTVYFSRSIPDPPTIDMAASVSDAILCKNEKVMVNVANTSAGWDYELVKQGSADSYGSAPGNGGNLAFQSAFINSTGNYFIRVSAQTNGCTRNFTNTIPITVEKTKSRLVSQYINSLVNETLAFNAISNDAQFYKWTFDNTASSTIVNGKTVQVSFSSAGTKNVELISWSANGCYDTATLKATTVVSETALTDECFNVNIPGSEPTWNGFMGSQLVRDMNVVNDGIIISGGDYLYALKSAVGDTVATTDYGGVLLAKYSKKGTLRWRVYSKFPNYECPGCNNTYSRVGIIENIPQADGGNVMTGWEYANSWMYFNNGDSVQIAGTSTSNSGIFRSFVTKINQYGLLQWNGIFYGATVSSMKQDKFGNFWIICATGNQSYYEINGNTTTLMNVPAGGTDVSNMLIKLSATGAFISASGTGTAIADLQPDNNGDVWITGKYDLYAGKLYNSNGILAATLPAPTGQFTNQAYFVAKYNSSGNYQFHLASRGFTFYNAARPGQMALDSNNNVYIIGKASSLNIADSIQWLHSNGTATTMMLGGFYLMKLNPSGAVQWMNGTRWEHYESGGHTIAITNNRVYITANITTNPSNPWTGYITSSDGNAYMISNLNFTSILLCEYDYAGKLLRLSNSNTAMGGYIPPNRLVRDNGKFYLSGVTKRDNGGGYSYSVFNQTLNAKEGEDGWFMVLNDNLCYPSQTPAANAGNDRTVCSGEAATIGTASAAGSYYSWTSSPAGYHSSLANPTVAPNVSTTYYLSVINTSGSIAADTVTLNVTGPVADAGPNQQICGSASAAIGTSAVGGVTYSWTSNPAGFNSAAANPVVSPASTTTYYLQATGSGSCIGRDTVTVTVNPLPVANAGPDQNMCPANAVFLGVSGSPLNTYLWTPATGLSSATVADPVAQPAATTTYVLTVSSSATGCSKKDTVVVTVGNPPTPTITPSGSTTICGSGSVLLTSSSTWFNQQWMNNGTPISGATNPTYNATSSGSYTVKVIGGACESAPSAPVTVSVNATPATPLITGDASFCAGFSTMLSSTAGSGNQWYLNNSPIASATGPTYVTNQPGSYTVRTTVNGCASAFSPAVNVTVKPAPATPVATLIGNTLTSSASSGNQWYKNGVVIPGATGVSYVASSFGNYTVVVTVNGCSSAASNVVTYTPTAVIDPALDGAVFTYPNPVQEELYISNGTHHSLQYILFSAEGKELLRVVSSESRFNISMRSFAAGIYFVQVKDLKNGMMTMKKFTRN